MNMTTTTGSPANEPALYRPDAKDSGPLLAMVEHALDTTGMKPIRFGRDAVGDPWLVRDLRRGNRITPRREARVRAFMQEGR